MSSLLIIILILALCAVLVIFGKTKFPKSTKTGQNKPEGTKVSNRREGLFAKIGFEAMVKDLIDDSVAPFAEELQKTRELILNKIELIEKINAITQLSQNEQEQIISALKPCFKQLNDNVLELFEQVGLLQETIDSMKKTIELHPLDEIGNTNTSKPRVQVFYSKMVDSLNPLGFRIANLKNNDMGCAFRITMLNSQEGQYEIVENAAIQQELFGAFNPVITDSSVYEMIPPNATKIVVTKKGLLRKENDILVIAEKQTLKFE